MAIASLLSQDWLQYGNQIELIVVDDGDDPVGDLVLELLARKQIAEVKICHALGQKFGVGETCAIGVWFKYVRMCGPSLEERQRTIGAKRNIACAAATGEIIVHWDDDDWSAPGRIGEQMLMLSDSGKSVAGYCSMLFWEESRQRASRYENGGHYALGSSLCYRRDFWDTHHFPEQSIGEDNAFVHAAVEVEALIAMPGSQQMVARIHPKNTSKNKSNFAQVPHAEIPELFFHHLDTSTLHETAIDGDDKRISGY